MKFMVESTQVPDLSEAQLARLYEAMGQFYSSIPDGVTLECDYVRADRSGSWSVLDVPDRAALDAILAPFDGLVRVAVTEVLSASSAES